jgi:hypothetical protein
MTLSLPLLTSVCRLCVQGVGSGDPKADGFSNYGSLGQYQLFVKYPSTQLPEVPSLPPTDPLPPDPPVSIVATSNGFDVRRGGCGGRRGRGERSKIRGHC